MSDFVGNKDVVPFGLIYSFVFSDVGCLGVFVNTSNNKNKTKKKTKQKTC